MTDDIDKRVDEDWKRRARQEKAKLDQQFGGPGPAGAGPPRDPDSMTGFTAFISTLAAQAAMFLGIEPDPLTGARRPNPEQARYIIDTLGMLEQKTRGNLDPNEDAYLRSVLVELRMAFVEVTRGPARRGPGAGPRGPL